MTTIGGLPAHILLVHAVVGLVPASALVLVLVAVWPAARRRFAWAAAALAVVTLVMVPVTTDAGEWLERRVERTALVRAHTELGDTLLPWVIGLAVIAIAILARTLVATEAPRRGPGDRAGGDRDVRGDERRPGRPGRLAGARRPGGGGGGRFGGHRLPDRRHRGPRGVDRPVQPAGPAAAGAATGRLTPFDAPV